MHITKPLEGQRAAAGEDVVLSCELSRAGAPVRWLRAGKAIRESQKYDLVTEGTRAMLVVRAVSPKDSGEYTCETEASKSTASLLVEGDPTRDPGMGPHGLGRGAAHGGGRSLSRGAGMGSEQPSTPLLPTPFPEKANRFTEELADLQAEEKGTAVFVCKTELPAATVTWRKGLADLRASRKYTPSQEGLTLKLTISALDKADTDTYSCDIGQACSQARLLVQGEAWRRAGLRRG